MKYFLFIFLIGLVFTGCSDDNEDVDNLFNNNNSKVVLRLSKDIFVTFDNNRKNSISEGDPFTIIESKREGDNLQITLSYGGGCKEHSFEVIWDGIVYTDDPCKMNLLLIHRGNNDYCEALITDTININLKELIGSVSYKDDCTYHIFSTYNFSENPDIIINAIN
ncbi:MAG: hypothetical protein ABFR32_13070 [Bacteroidota bacterium]